MKRIEIDQENLLRLLICIGGLLIAGLVGYRAGLSSSSHPLGRDLYWSRGRSTGAAKCQNGEEVLGAGRTPAEDTREADYYAVLVKHHLEEKGRRMAAVFSNTDVGHALAQA